MKTIKGISFPFRIGVTGGVVMTKSDAFDSTHLGESIHQIIVTQVGERIMEILGSQVSYQIFEPNDESTHTLIKYEITEAIKKHDKRVLVTMDDVEVYGDEEKVFVTVNYLVLDTNKIGSITVQTGGIQ